MTPPVSPESRLFLREAGTRDLATVRSAMAQIGHIAEENAGPRPSGIARLPRSAMRTDHVITFVEDGGGHFEQSSCGVRKLTAD